MRTRAGIIVQARVGSSRLPAKALEPIGGCSILERCLRRLISSGVAHVVLATTRCPEDDVLAVIAGRLGVPVFRGSEHDVLDRFAGAALAYGLDPIVRATADNPAVDIQAPGRVLAALREADADYVREEGLPYGAGVEAIATAAIVDAAGRARAACDREHVTTYIRSHRERYRVLAIDAPAPLRRPSLRLTVDTAADLAWVRELFFRTGEEEPSLAQIIAAAGTSSARAGRVA